MGTTTVAGEIEEEAEAENEAAAPKQLRSSPTCWYTSTCMHVTALNSPAGCWRRKQSIREAQPVVWDLIDLTVFVCLAGAVEVKIIR